MRTARFVLRSKSGFTLVELLVTVAVFALLTAILFPALAQARESARRTHCASNMRQVSQGFQMYLQDYDEVLPNAVDNVGGRFRTGAWMYYTYYPANEVNRVRHAYDVRRGTLSAYVQHAEVFVCPTDAQGRLSGNSYAANACLFYGPRSGLSLGKPAILFDTPAEMLLLAEENRVLAGASATNSTDDSYLATANLFSERHARGSNLTFLDGHLKWYRPEQVQARAFRFGGAPRTGCP